MGDDCRISQRPNGKIKGTLFYSKYQEMTKDKDLVIGSIANDRMFLVIDNFFGEA